MTVIPLGRATPATTSTVPASRSRGARTARARLIRPKRASSAQVRTRLRIRVVRGLARVPGLAAGPAAEVHTTRFRRHDRGLMGGLTHVAAAYALHATLPRLAAADSLMAWNIELWDEVAARYRACAWAR